MQNVPLGLEVLADMDHILIEQKKETLEFLSSVDAANKYTVKCPLGQPILYAEEHSNFFARNLLGKSRGFDLKIYNRDRRELVNVNRKFKCGLFACCMKRCLEDMTVTSPTKDQLYGSVVQMWKGCCNMDYVVLDEEGQILFRIRPPNKMIFFSDWEFQLVDEQGQTIGEIRKKWAGLAQEMFTQADNFGITFPVNLDVKHKVLLISACFLLVSLF